MNENLINIISALAIAGVIGLMATLKDSKIRALIYTLPIPISIALIATGGQVSSFNLIGLIMVGFFIWGNYYLYDVKGFPILASDIVLALGYVLIGFMLANTLSISYGITAFIFLILWVSLAVFIRNKRAESSPRKKSSLPAWAKAGIVFVLAYILLSLKAYLAGFVVTFPFSGVFAVYEGRDMLKILGAIVIRNTIALWAFFTTIYFAKPHIGVWLALLAGWAVFGIILYIAMKYVPLKNVGKPAAIKPN